VPVEPSRCEPSGPRASGSSPIWTTRAPTCGAPAPDRPPKWRRSPHDGGPRDGPNRHRLASRRLRCVRGKGGKNDARRLRSGPRGHSSRPCTWQQQSGPRITTRVLAMGADEKLYAWTRIVLRRRSPSPRPRCSRPWGYCRGMIQHDSCLVMPMWG
jgi:hypothetical protein